MTDLVVRNARLVATLDAERRELAGGWVAITGGLVEAVGTSTDPVPAATTVIDAGGCMVLGVEGLLWGAAVAAAAAAVPDVVLQATA